MSEPMHISSLFDKRFLDEAVLDEELVLQFEKTYRIVRNYCERHGIEWSQDFDSFRDRLHGIWDRVRVQSDDELIDRLRRGRVYVKANPEDINAKILLAGIIHRLQRRGFNTDLLVEKPDSLKEIFGDLAYEA